MSIGKWMSDMDEKRPEWAAAAGVACAVCWDTGAVMQKVGESPLGPSVSFFEARQCPNCEAGKGMALPPFQRTADGR